MYFPPFPETGRKPGSLHTDAQTDAILLRQLNEFSERLGWSTNVESSWNRITDYDGVDLVRRKEATRRQYLLFSPVFPEPILQCFLAPYADYGYEPSDAWCLGAHVPELAQAFLNHRQAGDSLEFWRGMQETVGWLGWLMSTCFADWRVQFEISPHWQRFSLQAYPTWSLGIQPMLTFDLRI